MEKNYYDILQINKNASPEIVEKAYKVLAKKYHPDLQTEENKKKAEEILKEINEAYETLSNLEKKQAYDNSLLQEEHQAFEETRNPNTIDSNSDPKEDIRVKQQQELLYQHKLQQEKIYQEQLLQQARQKAYHDAYIQDLKNRGYKIRYKKTFKDYLKGLITLILSIFILLLICQIPFVKKFFINFYESNEIIKSIVDTFFNIFH